MSKLTLSEAYATVQYGDIAQLDALRVLYSGGAMPLMYDHNKGTTTAPSPASWVGEIPGATGIYFVASPYVAGTTFRPTGAGLRQDNIASIHNVFAEIDEDKDGHKIPLVDQCAMVDELEKATGIRFGLATLSGDSRPGCTDKLPSHARVEVVPGKSLHVDIILNAVPANPANLALRDRAANALCALLGADPRARDVARKRRLPTAFALTDDVKGVRVQTCLRAEPITYNLAMVVDALESLCADRNIDIAASVAGDVANSSVFGFFDVTNDTIPTSTKTYTGSVSKNPAVPVPAGTVFQDRDGNTYTLDSLFAAVTASNDRKLAFTCVNGESHLDNRTSCFAYARAGGIGISCSSCGGHWSSYLSGAPVIPAQGSKGAVAVQVGRDALGHLVMADVIRSTKGKDIVVLATDTGSGKTHVAGVATKQARKKKATVNAACPTRSLSRSMSHRMGQPCYLDAPEDQWMLPGGWVFCTPSLRRAPSMDIVDGIPVDKCGDLLILDEFEQQLRSLASDLLKDSESRDGLAAIRNHLRYSPQVILMDAHAGELTRYLLESVGRMGDVAWVTAPANKPRDIVVYERRGQINEAIVSEWGHGGKPVIVVQSVAESKVLGKLLAGPGCTRKVCVLNADTVGDYDLASINEWVGQYDALVYTPVIGTGVSIDLKGHFTKLFAIVNNRQGTVHDLQQQLDRVRDLMTQPVHLYGTHAITPEAWEYDADKVYDMFVAREIHALRRAGITRSAPEDRVIHQDGRPILNPEAEAYSRFVALAHATDRRNGSGRVSHEFIRRNEEAGGTITRIGLGAASATEEALAEQRLRIKGAVKAEDREDIITAPVLDEETQRKVHRRGPKTRAESLGMKRLGVVDFYGTDILDHALLAFDDNCKGRGYCRTYTHVVAKLAGGTMGSRLLDMDRHELTSGVSSARLRHRGLVASGIGAVLKQAGLGQPFSSTTMNWVGPDVIQVPMDKALAVAVWASANRDSLRPLGITVGKNVLVKPMQFLQGILGRMGLHLRKTRTRLPDGSRARSYALHKEDVEFVERMASHYAMKMAGGLLIRSTAEDEETIDLTADDIARITALADAVAELSA